jgi:hypothetical protein
VREREGLAQRGMIVFSGYLGFGLRLRREGKKKGVACMQLWVNDITVYTTDT